MQATSDTFEAAVQRHRAGQLGAAEQLYLAVREGDANYANACFLAGALALADGRSKDAVDRLTRAVAIAPQNAAYLTNLGEAYRRLGHFTRALDTLLRAVHLNPNLAEATYNLGALLEQRSDPGTALACYERAAQLKPDLPGIAERIERLRRAEDRRATGSAANGPAIAAGSAGLLGELAEALRRQGRVESALGLFERALELNPRSPALLTNFGLTLEDLGRFDEAAASYRRALALDPNLPETLVNLGGLLMACGSHGEAVEMFRRALGLRPEPRFHGSLIFFLPFCQGYDAKAVFEEVTRYGEWFLGRVPSPAPHANDPDPERRLRVGYVGAHFREHCQASFLSPLLASHDRRDYEIFCYSSVINPDETTDAFRSQVDGWRSIAEVGDEDAEAQIRRDRIDVLVDLTMHMEGGRLPLFARKPAPVQITWLAYPGTTGLPAIDYRVTDPFLDPPGCDESVYVEPSLRLPDSFWCYSARAPSLEVGPQPADREGWITFGCLNNFFKVNTAVLDLWGRVLRDLDRSRLVVLVPPGQTRERVREHLEQMGVDRTRLELVDRRPRLEYLASYRDIDIVLDTFPYGGHTTSLDAWWMGVPVVTLVGDTVVGRAGLCHAMNLGLPELIAHTPDEYVRIAKELATDRDRLRDLRAGLRARMEASPLMDAPRFARNLEAAYRMAWRRWCEGAAQNEQTDTSAHPSR